MKSTRRYKFPIAENGFNFAEMLILKILVFPFSVLYDFVTRVRNHAYNIGSRSSVEFNLPIINVGNLTVGGTGKTPHVEFIVTHLKEKYNIAILSRGYKRNIKGFLLADQKSGVDQIGDEPMQFWTKFGPNVAVAVGEDRAMAIPQIIHENEKTNLILLDDAFQHRAVKPGFNILLSDYSRPFYKDFLMPSGLLRESRSNANRADVVVITKCDKNLSNEEQKNISLKVNKYLKRNQPVLFSYIKYGKPINVFDNNMAIKNSVFGLAGIAKSTQFKEYLNENFELEDFIEFPDHHKYSESDLMKIINKIGDCCLICTEKDMVKLKSFSIILNEIPVFYIPIEIEFINGNEGFNSLINNHLMTYN